MRFVRPQPHPSPASASHSSRLTRPSPTQAPVSTPGPKISRFRDKPRLEDEIETSFEEGNQPSPQPPSRSRFSSSVSQYRDVVEDPYEDTDCSPGTTKKPPTSRRDPTAETKDNDLADLEFLETLRRTRTSPPSRNPNIDSSSSDEDSFTPFASRKRRRLENRTDHAFNDSEDDNQTPHNLAVPSTTRINDEDGHTILSSPSEIPSSPLAPSTPQPPSTTTSRFKLQPHPHTPSLPSKSASASASTSTSTSHPTSQAPFHKPSFRLPPSNKSYSTNGPSLATLPAAFSPSSRRRGGGGKGGGRDYLPGGAADSVRNLILGLGGTDEWGRGQGHGQRGAGVERVRVGGVSGPDGGRFVVVRDAEERGRRWVFIGEDEGSGVHGGRARRKVEKGSLVGVRMGWDVDLSLKSGKGSDDEQGDAGDEDVWKVAVLWDVLDG